MADVLGERRFLLRAAVVLLVALYFLSTAIPEPEWHFLDGVDLLIHEAGHVVLAPFGEFIAIAGGTVMQLLVPSAFVVYFFRRGEAYSAAFVLFWVGQNLINISVYAGDAIAQKLNLVGGEIHDWHYLLTRLNVLEHTRVVSTSFYLLGIATMLAACVAGISAAKQEEASLADAIER